MTKIHIGLKTIKQSPKEVVEYIINNKDIPVELFNKYHDNYACKHNVTFTCELCNQIESTGWDVLNNRLKLYNKCCCKKCSYIYSSCLRENIPEHLIIYYFNHKNVPFDIYLENYKYNANKLFIEFTCDYCNKLAVVKWGKIKYRQHSSTEKICNHCIQKHTSNLPIVKQRNSDAQQIVQNTYESKEKQRIAQIKRCKEKPESVEKQRIGLKKFYTTDKGMQLRGQVAERLKNSGHLRGFYNGIKFDSSWELSTLVYYEKDNIQRCNFKIPYVYKNEQHIYLPDFVLNNCILEIKGRREDINIAKLQGAELYLQKHYPGMKYRILYYKDLKKLDDFIMYDNILKLNLLDKTKLTIVEYPKSWKINMLIEDC